MEQTNVIVPTDAELEKDFSNFCDEVGMSIETAIIIFMKKNCKGESYSF
ncbi:MAG: hypothetical protein IJI45_03045 [Anaerolineaceae bacterium]|nr:hypothetical protein [Anaerolineaceae bacterium]